MEEEDTLQSALNCKQIYLYRAFWIALSEIDRCRCDRDRSDYKFRSRAMQIASFQSLCEQHDLQRFGNKDYLQKLTGDRLYQALANQWYQLCAVDSMRYPALFEAGTGSCNPERLKEYRKAHEAFDQGRHLLLSENVTVSKRVVVEIPAPQSGFEEDNVALLGTHRDDRKDNAYWLATSRETRSDNRKRKLSVSTSVPRKSSTLSAVQSNINVNFASISSAPIAFDSIKEEFLSIYDTLHQSVLWLSSNLRLDKCQAVVSPEPHYFLLPLYKRCWGEDWRTGADLLLAERNRSVEDDTLALISAFLLERILLQTGLCKPKLNETNEPEPSKTQSAENNDDKALSSLAQAALFAIQADSLTAQLINALIPYIEGLAQMSRLMYATCFKGEIDPLSHPPFRRSLSRAVEKALELRIRLDDLKDKAAFLWPERGQLFDPVQMQTPYEQDDDPSIRYTVAFTKFPGIKLEYLRHEALETEVAYKACVVLRAEAAK